MDGNGRWAELRGLPRLDGHARGSRAVREVVTGAREIGLEAITLYAFSAQNWSRPAEEVAGLMRILYEYLEQERPTLLDNDIRLSAIGQLDRLPSLVLERLLALERETERNRSMVLTLALSYGGREELVEAARTLAREVAAGRLSPDQIDEAALERCTFTRDLPPLDLIVRTSGELRLSNFLLWQAAYAEIVVTDVLWPDFGKRDLVQAIEAFRRRQRRFGKTGRQLAEPEGSEPELD
ncbi:MAG: di-trans,poly-cis-decaprenylcistransferase [Deltaproteobacteria bacterium]|nr:di-trans,poly-cis-decaprenylcistransferase [Deltaproteobacteria bacterium]